MPKKKSTNPLEFLNIKLQNFANSLNSALNNKSFKITQREMAERIGVEESVVGKWVKGESKPTLDSLFLIMEFLAEHGMNPLQTLFNNEFQEEVDDIHKRYEAKIKKLGKEHIIETNILHGILLTDINQASIERNDELEEDLFDTQDLLNESKAKYKNLVNKIKKSPENCKESLLEYLIESEKADKFGNKALIEELEKIIEENY